MSIRSSIENGILRIVIDNPPVNALSQVDRAGIFEALIAAEKPEVIAIIFVGANKRFVAGADIGELGLEPKPPHLPAVIDAIENCPKPVIAAIAGQALGGGLELALACHYRIAASSAKFGMPEVTLGLVPGAGGTQRLPRLIGPLPAAQMISTGKAIDAAEAHSLGLIDAIAGDEDVLDAAVRWCSTLDGHVPDPRRLSTRSIVAGPGVVDALEALELSTKKRARGAEAPAAAIMLVKSALVLPYAEGVRRERETFLALRSSRQSEAMRYIFYAERKAAKLEGLEENAVPRKVERIGIVGAGTMGTGIAMNFADAGLATTIVETSAAALESGMDRIAGSYRSMSDRRRITPDESSRRTALVTGSTDYAALSESDLIIEAAFETMEVKNAIFRQLDEIAKSGAILASNTSYLDLDAIAAQTERPQDVVGMHYFSPANIMRLLEVVRGEQTSPEVLATAIAVARRTNKVPVVARVCNGFIGNRMLRAYNREAGLLLLEGATVERIDAALTGFGMAMGPFAVADLSGIDIGFKARQSMSPGSYEPLATVIHDSLVEAGHLGRKTASGFYCYDDNGQNLGPNPLVGELAKQARLSNSIEAREVDEKEITDRCLYALVNEGGHIVSERIAARTADIDVVYVNGYGFPRHLGGPMFHAETIGLEHIRQAVTSLQAGRFGRWWAPCDFIKRPFDGS